MDMAARRVLIIEDDVKLADLVRMYLERDGYRVTVAHEGREGLGLARHGGPDLIILDLMLPGMSGSEICRTLRRESEVPIIMLTARTTEDDKLAGLDLGADDYVTKPFSPREVVARVRTVLRRSRLGEQDGVKALAVGEIEIDLAGHTARLRGEDLRLTVKEFNLLALMARQPGKAFSRLELLAQVFGPNYDGLERTVDVHMMNLRKKIEADPAQPVYVQTVYGVGYRLGGGYANTALD
jgi:DNA-binding response OmpR family regulator